MVLIETGCHKNEYTNLTVSELLEHSIRMNEGVLSSNGALRVLTGARTGRSPKDKFIVRDSITDSAVNWGDINQPFEAKNFELLWNKACNYIKSKDIFISNLSACNAQKYRIKIKMISTCAWHNLFANCLLVKGEINTGESLEDWTILSVPELKTDPNTDPGVNSDATLIINFSDKKILLCGHTYAGEIKKSVFSVMNFLLPALDVLPMHCSANFDEKYGTALLFGLSGTGKTTLSADPKRYMIGDDEHGWCPDTLDKKGGVFNIEGGCYAKCINLSEKNEPDIYGAIKFGSVIENVVLDQTRNPDFTSTVYTQNTRAAYPIQHISKRYENGLAPQPKSVIFLTCDLFGVLPPVSILTRNQAAYYFLSGYTALVGSTEIGQTEDIKTTFSTCFGAPFFPRNPNVYTDLLMKRLDETKATVYLVNTGWSKGAYGHGGERFSIPFTRSIIDSILDGTVLMADKKNLAGFNFSYPVNLQGLDPKLLDPLLGWKDTQSYLNYCNQLIEKFISNAAKFNMKDDVKNAGPNKIYK